MERGLMQVRPAETRDVDALSKIWHEGWHDAHARLMPAELTNDRTLESFRERLPPMLADTSVAEASGAPLGFCSLKDDELYQLYVDREARGSGAAQALVADAEKRLADMGVATAWLACAIGNDRAARFYEKCGWVRAGTQPYREVTTTGTFEMDVWRYEKQLAHGDLHA